MADTSAPPEGLEDFLKAPAIPSSGAPTGLDEFIAPEVREEKYGTPIEMTKTFAEGAGKEATFGGSTWLEKKLGVKPEDIAAREEVNPIAHGAGQIAGLVGSSLLVPGGGAAGLMEATGAGAVRAVGLGAAESIGAKVGAAALKAGVENALFQSGNEVSKLVLGTNDPSHPVETAAVNIGLSGLIGAGIGGALGSISPLWKATIGKKVAGQLEDIASNVEEVGSQSPLSPDKFQRDILNEDLATQRPSSQEALQAFDRLGIKPPEGAMSDIRTIRNISSETAKNATLPGRVLGRQYEAAEEGLRKSTWQTLRDRTENSAAQVGKEIKEGLAGKLEEELKPIEAKYESLKTDFKKMPVSPGLKEEALKTITSHDFAKADPDLAKFAEKLSSRVENVENLDQLKIQRTLINKELTAAYRAADPKSSILQAAKNALTSLREGTLSEAAAENPGAAQAIEKIRSADSEYASYKGKLRQLGTEAGLGNLNDARSLLDRFRKLSDESFAKKVFDTNDVNQMAFFKEHFPKEFDLARRFKLQEIAEKSASTAQGEGARLDVRKFLTQLRKLSPEAKQDVFPGYAEKLNDIQTVYQTIPGNMNPSGTAAAQRIAHLFSPEGLMENLSDAAKLAFLKSMPAIEKAGSDSEKLSILKFLTVADKGVNPEGFKAMSDVIENVVKGENLVAKATKNVFQAGREIVPDSMIPSDKKIARLDEKLKELQANQEPLLDTGGHASFYLPDHGTAMAKTAANAVSYLNSLRPKTAPINPLDEEMEPSKAEKEHFDRALKIAEQPLLVLESLKKGTLTTFDIGTMKTLYPALHSRVSEKLTNHLIEARHKKEPISYKVKMGLSLFLGQPLDSTMTPQSLQSIQSHFQMAQAQRQAEPQAPHQSSGSMKSLSKLSQSYLTPQQARQQSRGGKL